MKKMLVVIAALIAAATAQAQAQTFSETARAFRKLDAKLDAGTSYSRYSEALGDLQFAVSEYAANANEANKANVEGFRRALDGYKKAGRAWGRYTHLVSENLHLDRWYEEIATKTCPGVPVSYDSGVDKCLNQAWAQAKEATKGLREVPDAPAQK